MAKTPAARLGSGSLPSVTVDALAERCGCTVDLLGEYIRTGQLPVHVLLHDAPATYRPKKARFSDHSSRGRRSGSACR